MRRLVLPLALLVALAGLGGCYNVNYVSKTRAPSARVVEHDLSFWIIGLVGTEHIDLAQDCPSGVSRIRTVHTVVDSVLTIITIGIYAPRTVKIVCAQ